MSPFVAKPFLATLLIFTIVNVQICPCLADAPSEKLKVALVGIKFRDLPLDIQDILLWRLTAILEAEEAFVLTKPDAAQIAYGREKLSELLEKQDIESFRAFATQFGFNYVFAGQFANQSPDENQIRLVGEFVRFDLATELTNRYEINESYDKFGNRLVSFKQEYVTPVAKLDDSGFDLWPILLLGGLAVAGAVAIGTGAVGFGGDTGSGQADAK
jgi:hypothetical protein